MLQNDFIADMSSDLQKQLQCTVSLDTQYCKKKMTTFIINLLWESQVTAHKIEYEPVHLRTGYLFLYLQALNKN